MKGIILAGGSGTRLYPITRVVSKQLLPIYDKPMIYYPLSILMRAGIKEVLIISTPEDLPNFKSLLGDGTSIGMKIEYIIQPSPDGLAQAFILGENFIGNDDVSLILGDNIFYGNAINAMLKNAKKSLQSGKATIFGYHVNDPERYGVAGFDDDGNVISIEEKPEKPKSNYAVVGLYFYPNDVAKKAKSLKPSSRGELEITALNELYLNEKNLKLEIFGRGNTWLDTGTHESLLEASQFVETIEKRQSLKIGCIEEIAYEMGYINKEEFLEIANRMKNNQYGSYLLKRAKEI
jgi:glucose-1-phosphate thymidylyltransferase